ncbi:MAG: phosphoserine transaminase [Candidatus Omnitrophica bacterium]|nr:phosphoserine transaminase [Candidatus Omnitrophota bacterium]MDD5099235.1 phosphoserine transaminase [Candidatus Colwellbacteria bacterium]
MKPAKIPRNPCFSSGPCAKHPGYSVEELKDTPFGRSHRSKLGKAKLAEAIKRTKDILLLPADYRVGIVPASDTGAFEMSMWSMLGCRGVDVLVWESFSKEWAADIAKQLKLKDARFIEAEYGKIPDFKKVDFRNDVVFVWNGTTSGVKVPNGDWIPDDREGLTFCDATSAVFAMDVQYRKLDVITFSWQKVLGGEGGHGMLILSPRAVQRLESYTPSWPLPKIFRLTRGGKLAEEIFEGSTINTPSMLANEDWLAALKWAESIGGLKALIQRSNDNLSVFEAFVAKHEWIHFLAETKDIRSNTSVCLKVDLSEDKLKMMVKMLQDEKAAYDIASYRDAPPGLRVWCGATVEKTDLQLLCEWIEWAYNSVK